MWIFFSSNEVVLDRYFMSNTDDLDAINYNNDYGTCMLICGHCHKHKHNISVAGVIWSGLCFTQLLIVSSLDKNDKNNSKSTA